MAEKLKPVDAMIPLHSELHKLSTSNRLTAAVKNADDLIQILTEARQNIASAPDLHTARLGITKLQNPVKAHFEKINDSLAKVSRVQKQVGKAIDKALPLVDIPILPLTNDPDDHDAMEDQTALINRAITMHLLREGQFSVASTFIAEAKAVTPHLRPRLDNYDDDEYDDESIDQDDEVDEARGEGGGGGGGGGAEDDEGDHEMDTDEDSTRAQAEAPGIGGPTRTPTQSSGRTATMLEGSPSTIRRKGRRINRRATATDGLTDSLRSQQLQTQFTNMYHILQRLKQQDLKPAIAWARTYTRELEERGSNLEFELCKLQYVHLFQTPPSSGGGPEAAYEYARANMQQFQDRHLKEMQQLAAALVFAPNLTDSPYASLFDSSTAFADVSTSFTREFCWLLGLSAESPLYVAATAGAVALPRLVKYMNATRQHGAEWTTAHELAFETPLPRSFMYHSVFVCPVSKEQTTAANPPMILSCGHVLAKDSLHNLAKGPRFKCPYCPYEGQVKDARVVIL